MVGSILAGLATGGISNLMSEWHADKQQAREKELMDYQNSLNKANALDSYRTSVQSMKMAGLNPAIAQDAKPLAPEVSKGTVSQAENVEFDPATMLLHAQAENLNAQTEKTEAETRKIEGVDTQNVEADTALKGAQTLLAGASKEKVDAEATHIGNINKVFAEENSAMGLFGQTTAQGWQKESWYSSLPKGAKMVIDDIAKGDFDLTVGFSNALDRMVRTDVGMNEAQKDKASYALTRAVIEGQMKTPKVMEALVNTPKAQYGEVLNRATNLAAETRMLDFDREWKVEQKEVWTKNDPDKLYAEYQKDPTVENAAKWLVGSMRSTGADLVKSSAPAAIHGGLIGSGMKSSSHSARGSKGGTEFQGNPKVRPNIYGADGTVVRHGYKETPFETRYSDHGVQELFRH